MATIGLSKVFILDKYFTELQKFWETERKVQGIPVWSRFAFGFGVVFLLIFFRFVIVPLYLDTVVPANGLLAKSWLLSRARSCIPIGTTEQRMAALKTRREPARGQRDEPSFA